MRSHSFADDFIIGCELESDARRIMDVLPKRFGRFGLSIHPEKTKQVAFGRPRRPAGAVSDDEQTSRGPGTFDFLGLTHYWSRSRRGNWVIKRRTAKSRVRRTMKSLWDWCKRHRHAPLAFQHLRLTQKLRGHYQYFGVRCNFGPMKSVLEWARRAWFYWLNRRRRHLDYNWDEFCTKVESLFPLPVPRIVHMDV